MSAGNGRFAGLAAVVHGYPLEPAMRIAVSTFRAFPASHEEPSRIILSTFDARATQAAHAALSVA